MDSNESETNFLGNDRIEEVETEALEVDTKAGKKEFVLQEEDMGEEWTGSIYQVLADNIENYVVAEFLIGSQAITRKEGQLYSMGQDYMVLYEEVRKTYTVCQLDSLRFITFYQPGERPPRSGNRGLMR